MNKLILLLLLAAAPVRAAQTIVTMGFDDGSASQMTALSLLNSHGMKATFYVNSGRLGESDFYLTRAQLDTIAASGHEIGGHTLSHAHLINLSASQAQTEVCGDRTQLQSFGYNPIVSFAYPYGEWNSSVRSIVIGCGYDNARGVGDVNCSGCANAETVPPLDRFVIRSVDSFENTTTLAQMQKVVTDAENSGGGWVHLVLHQICDNCDTYSTSAAKLTGFLDWLAPRSAQGTIVRTNAQVLLGGAPPPPPPSIASLSPSTAAAGGAAFTLSVTGSNFVSGATVTWNGANRTTTFVSATLVRAAITAADISSPGTRSVAVRNPGGALSGNLTFTVVAGPSGVPVLASISPSSAAVGGSSFTLTALGSAFTSGSTVRWNGEDRATVFFSTAQLRATVLASDIAAAGTAAVTVFTPAPGGGTSTVRTFLVYVPNPLPSLASISPSSAAVGGSSFTLTALGSGFVSGSTVRWNGSNRATVFVNSGQLTATVLSSDLSAAATAQVTVFSPGPGGGTSAARAFSVIAPPPPPAPTGALFAEQFPYPDGLITNENPASVQSGTWTVIEGSMFANAGTGWTGVPDGVTPNATSSNGTGSVFFRPFTKKADFGNVSLYFSLVNQGFTTVTAPQNWDGVHVILRRQAADIYYYLSVNRRDNTVVLRKQRGSTLTTFVSAAFPVPIGATQQVQADIQTQPNNSVLLRVLINGVQRATFTDAGTGGAAITGVGSVGVWGGNVNFRFDDFIVMAFGAAPSTGAPVPALASISPSSAAVGGSSFTLTALGSGFVSSSTVRWNGVDRPTLFVGDSQLTASIPAGDIAAAGVSSVTVFSPGPGGGTSTVKTFLAYVPNPSPSLASIDPSSATAGSSSFTLTAFGSGFVSASKIRWNGADRATLFVSSAQLTATIPASDLSTPSTSFVTVFSPGPGGGPSPALSFIVHPGPTAPPNPAPVLASIDPSSAAAGSSSFTLTAFGGGFVSASRVRWNGLDRATLFVSSAQLTATIPASDLSTPATSFVTVFSPGPGGGTSTARAFIVSAGTAPAALFSDDFNRPNALITNEFAFFNPTAAGSVISTTWTVTAGSLFVDANTAWTGVPDSSDPNAASSNATGSAVFRARTNRGDFGDVTVGFTLTNLGLVTTPATPSAAWDGVDLGLRYQSETSFYYFSVNRRNNTVVLKKKSGTAETTLGSAAYTVPFNTAQSVQASVKNNPNGSVTLTLTINGVQRLSVADAASPLSAAGAVAIRGNNANFRFDDFSVQPGGGVGVAELVIGAIGAAAATLDAFRIFPNPWRVDRHGGQPLRIDGLTDQSEVRFYTVAGRWVRTIAAASGVGLWDLNDDSGSRVASGLYLYLIKDAAGGRRRGVVAVIR